MSEKHSTKEDDWETDLDWLIKDSKDSKEESDEERSQSPIKSNHISDDKAENATTDESDYDDELTPDERKILHENTHLNDAEDGEEYDVLKRLAQANEALAGDNTKEERERRVNFKPKLIDFEVPPHDYTSSEEEEKINTQSEKMKELKLSDDESKDNDQDDTVVINGKSIHKNEKILIERDGQFELVEASELKGILPSSSSSSNSSADGAASGNKAAPAEEVHLPPVNQPKRPKSAPVKRYQPQPPGTQARPFSANGGPKPRSVRTFSYSPEMKKILQRQKEAKNKKEREEKLRKETEEESARQEAEDCWKAWLDRKNEDLKRQRKEQKEKSSTDSSSSQVEQAEECYKAWLREKRLQTKRERILVQQQQIEIDEGWYIRDRKDCNSAYKKWLRSKNEAARKAKDNDRLLRRQSLKEARQARKAQKLLQAIREAQQMKYVEYYGYRF